MTPERALARAFADALVDGPWASDAMAQRLEAAIGTTRPWIPALVRAVLRVYDLPPRDATASFARWLCTRRAFGEACRERGTIRRWPLPPPAMGPMPWPVPVLETTAALAEWLGLTIDELVVLADRRGLSRRGAQPARHYRYRVVTKRTGGARLLEAPKSRLKCVQRRILDGVLAQIPPHEAAHGFRRGHSVVDSAAPHVGRRVVLRIDLQAFFTSVLAPRVYGIFRTAGYPEEVARIMTALCTHGTPGDELAKRPTISGYDAGRLRAPHLPQGAPTSGALANLAAYRLDVRVAAFARVIGARYTRYADDLVLSGDTKIFRAAASIVARVSAIAIEEGFAVNARKTRVMGESDRQRVTGIVVNQRLSIGRDELERLRATLHNCARTGPALQNRDAVPDFRAYLAGRIAWVASLTPDKALRLQAMFERIDWR